MLIIVIIRFFFWFVMLLKMYVILCHQAFSCYDESLEMQDSHCNASSQNLKPKLERIVVMLLKYL